MPKRKNNYEPNAALPYSRSHRVTDGNAFPIFMETDEKLLDENSYLVRWYAMRNYVSYYEKTFLGGKSMPRYMILDIITDAFRDHERRGGVVFDQHGNSVSLPDPIDDVFDPSLRWFSEYVRTDKSGLEPYEKKKITRRLRWLDVAMKILYLEHAPLPLGVGEK